MSTDGRASRRALLTGAGAALAGGAPEVRSYVIADGAVREVRLEEASAQ